jgi:hypothetical protein
MRRIRDLFLGYDHPQPDDDDHKTGAPGPFA